MKAYRCWLGMGVMSLLSLNIQAAPQEMRRTSCELLIRPPQQTYPHFRSDAYVNQVLMKRATDVMAKRGYFIRERQAPGVMELSFTSTCGEGKNRVFNLFFHTCHSEATLQESETSILAQAKEEVSYHGRYHHVDNFQSTLEKALGKLPTCKYPYSE